jgi:hypothetical protein
MKTSAVRPPDPCPDCKQATLQTSSKNDSRVWGGIGYSGSVATGGSARLQQGKDVVVKAPTGSGKTYIFELLYPNLKTQAVFTVPTRAVTTGSGFEPRLRAFTRCIQT